MSDYVKKPVAKPADTNAINTRFKHACHLAECGRNEEAKEAYLALLADAPSHFGALNNLGNLVYSMGFTSAARTLYLQAIEHHPGNPAGYVNLANVLAASHEKENARKYFEAALRLEPDHREAHRGLSYVLTDLREEEQAALHRSKAFDGQPVLTLPYYGTEVPVPILILFSARGGAIPMQHHFNPRMFQVSVIFVEFFDCSAPLPAHQLIINAIGDADLCKPALQDAIKIIANSTAPVINHPLDVLSTGRAENAARLGQIEDVITPRTVLLPRAVLEHTDVAAHGFTFPLLIRAPGFHTGHFFIKVENAEDLKAHLPEMPGDELLLIEYLDARSPDGKIRKYRVMMIEGVLYPLHVAISTQWKIHYFTADMANNTENRAEDERFLYHMEEVLGARAMAALHAIAKALRLEYGGMDFSVDAQGKILLYEANATMVVYAPDKDPRWEYRRQAVERIMAAIQKMVTPHA